MKNKNLLVKMIIIFIVLIIIIIVALAMLSKKDIKQQENNNIPINKEQSKISKVNSYNDYFGVKNAIEKYLIYLSMENNEAIYSLLDKEYIAKNSITVENVISKLKKTNKTEVLINEMVCEKESDYNTIYYVKGNTYEYNEEEYNFNSKEELKREYEELNIIVKHDKYNMTFSIIPN